MEDMKAMQYSTIENDRVMRIDMCSSDLLVLGSGLDGRMPERNVLALS